VCWVDAGSIVAGVAHQQVVSYKAIKDLVGNTVRFVHFVFNAKISVTKQPFGMP
jgi:hypothetical protein